MKKMLKLFDPYIALMLAMIALAAAVPVHGRGTAIAATTTDIAIAFLFFLYGTRLSPKAAVAGFIQWKLQIAVLLCTFALFPLLGVGLGHLMAGFLQPALLTGLVVLCLMPSTVQSSIAFTSVARGNVAAALCAASLSNILGVFISPLLVGWLLQTGGVALSFDVFGDIMLQLLAPFLASQLFRPWIGAWIQRHKQILGYADRGSILLIIYVAFSKGMVENVWGGVSLSDLSTLIVPADASARHYPHPDRLHRAAAAVAAGRGQDRPAVLRIEEVTCQRFADCKPAFPGPQLSLVLLPLMLFHQIQLIACAVLARRYGAEADRRTSPDAPVSAASAPATS